MKQTTPLRLATLIVLFLMTTFAMTLLSFDMSIAQIDPTSQQQTVDAAIGQRFTETAQAQQQLAITQTIDAAFNQALTATAAFQGTVDAGFNQALTATAHTSRINWKLGTVSIVEPLPFQVFHSARFSPGGNEIAWGNLRDSLCIYRIREEILDCYLIPFNARRISNLAWSSNNQFVAFTEDYSSGYETDIWILDVNSGIFENLTNDGVDGLFGNIDTTSSARDIQPVWDSTDNGLYFFRSRTIPSNEFEQGIFYVSLNSKDTTPIWLFTEEFNSLIGFSGIEDNDILISPDGTKISFVSNDFSESSGAWILDLTANSLRQIASLDDLFTGFTYPITDANIYPETLRWIGNDQILVTASGSDGLTTQSNFTVISVANGQIQSLNQLIEPYLVTLFEGDFSPRVLSVIVDQKSNTLFIVCRGEVSPQHIKILSIPNSLNLDDITLVGEFDYIDAALLIQPLTTLADNNTALIGAYLVSFEAS